MKCKGKGEIGRIKSIIFVKIPSKYLIKKYGYEKAFSIMMKKALVYL